MPTSDDLKKAQHFLLKLAIVGGTFMGIELLGIAPLSPYLYFFEFMFTIFIAGIHFLLYLRGKYVPIGYVIAPPIYIFIYQFASIKNLLGTPVSEIKLQLTVVTSLLLLTVLVGIARVLMQRRSS